MNRIVTHHIPASELPEKLRGEIPVGAMVTVTVQEDHPRRALSFKELRERAEQIKSSPGFRPVNPEEAVRRIRELRDEWDR